MTTTMDRRAFLATGCALVVAFSLSGRGATGQAAPPGAAAALAPPKSVERGSRVKRVSERSRLARIRPG